MILKHYCSCSTTHSFTGTVFYETFLWSCKKSGLYNYSIAAKHRQIQTCCCCGAYNKYRPEIGSSTFAISGLNFSSSMKVGGKTSLNFSLYKTSNLVDHNPLCALRISDFIHSTDAASSRTFTATGRSGDVTEAAVVTFLSLLAFEMLTDNF